MIRGHGLGREKYQVRHAPTIRRPEALDRTGGVRHVAYYRTHPAFRSGCPGPDPDLLKAGHGPKVINVPVQFLASSNMPQKSGQQVPLG
jgi:hypothetical protein